MNSSSQLGLDLLHDARKSGLVVHGDVRQHLAVDLDAGLADAVGELAVRQAALTGGCVDTRDPQRTELTLASAVVDPATTLAPPASAGGSCGTTTKSPALNLVTSFQYDAGGTGPGNVTQITDPDRNATTFLYDRLRRLTTRSAPLNALTRYCYDADGQLLGLLRR